MEAIAQFGDVLVVGIEVVDAGGRHFEVGEPVAENETADAQEQERNILLKASPP